MSFIWSRVNSYAVSTMIYYKQSHGKKEFSEMYREEKTSVPKTDEPVVVTEEIKSDEKTEIAADRQPTAKKTRKREKVATIVPVAKTENNEPGDVIIDESNGDVKTSTEPAVKKTKKKKRLDHKIFSRAPLRDEEYAEEDSVSVSRN